MLPHTHTLTVADYSSHHLVMDLMVFSDLHSVEVLVLRDSRQEGKQLLHDLKRGQTKSLEFEGLRPGCIYTIRSVATLTDGKKLPAKEIVAFTQAEEGDLGDFGYSRPSQAERSIGGSGTSGQLKIAGKQFTKPKFEDLKGLSASEKLFGGKFETDAQLVKLVGGKQSLQKALMAGRKAPSLDHYLNQTFKFARPPTLQKERMQRALVYGNALIKLEQEQIAHERLQDGYQVFGNSWGMGPFYVWDKNLQDIRSERDRLQGISQSPPPGAQ